MNIKIENLRALCQSILTDRGLDAADAHIVTDILIEAELRGRPTHGMIRLPGIAERVSQGNQSPMVTEKDAPAYALIDGRDNLGYLVAHRSACTAIDKAKQSGVGVVGARDTSHSGMLGYYASMIADAEPNRIGHVQHRPAHCPLGRTTTRTRDKSHRSGLSHSRRPGTRRFFVRRDYQWRNLDGTQRRQRNPRRTRTGTRWQTDNRSRTSAHRRRIALWRTQRIRFERHDTTLLWRIAQCRTRTRNGEKLRNFHAIYRSLNFFGHGHLSIGRWRSHPHHQKRNTRRWHNRNFDPRRTRIQRTRNADTLGY